MDRYARGLGYLCMKCSEGRRGAFIAVAVVIFVVLGAAAIFLVVSIRNSTSDNEAVVSKTERVLKRVRLRLRRVRAYQSMKIIVVSWQIITQASISG